MHFEEGNLYHIYNQGNNRGIIFFNRSNYLFFISKIKKYILQYVDILAWCLMPNHFHLMVHVCATHRMTISLNNSIGIMLRSYTRAIQKQENITGSLFRQKTKAICLTCSKEVASSFYNTHFGTLIQTNNTSKQYPQVCFNYIHQNPVKAGFVNEEIKWEFSSAGDYYGNRDRDLINKEVALEFISCSIPYSSDAPKSSEE